MTEVPLAPARSALVARMVADRQLSALDADALEDQPIVPDTEEEILQWLAGEYGLEYTALENSDPDRSILSRFPARILLREEMLPLREENGHVEVAVSRLFAAPGLDSLKTFTELKLHPVLAPSAAVQREIKKHLGVGADTLNLLEQEEGFQVVADERADEGDLDKAAEDASIIRFVNQILGDALGMRTSDIHVEPFEHELRIRYRIDGLLQEVSVPAQIKRFQPAIVSRIKILSNLNIAEKRVPQDGRIKIRVKNSDVDIRVSVIPMLHGEAVVMRLLRQDAGLIGLEGMGMADRDRRLFERVLEMPHGIALVTGPTGSGKTTTLYSALTQINDSVRKIITIEDPVEYQLKGINQIQVSEKAGLTFARGLRAILRHDPDVVLIGEIRDQETAQIAVQASLTGHMVFSTLHTNDAPGALTRLVDMGVEPYLVASSLEAVIAQRLVRVLCPECKCEDTSVRTQELRQNVGEALRGATIFRATGCKSCRLTGYTGRRALFELMTMSSGIRKVLLRGGSSLETKEIARREGMRTLIEDGWRLVRDGVTSVTEVLRVSKEDDAVWKRRNWMKDEGRRQKKTDTSRMNVLTTKAGWLDGRRLTAQHVVPLLPSTFCLLPSLAMPTFEYKALQGDGLTTQGRVEAGGRGDAMQILEDRGWTPLRLAELGGGAVRPRRLCVRRRRATARRLPVAIVQERGREMGVGVEAGVVRGVGGFHASAVEFAHGGRATQPRANHSLQGNLPTRRGREMA